MCGIIGYKGLREASGIILEGLRNLEYRGYDSVGIATIDNGKLNILKDIGKVEEANRRNNFDDIPGNISVGHMRWARQKYISRQNILSVQMSKLLFPTAALALENPSVYYVELDDNMRHLIRLKIKKISSIIDETSIPRKSLYRILNKSSHFCQLDKLLTLCKAVNVSTKTLLLHINHVKTKNSFPIANQRLVLNESFARFLGHIIGDGGIHINAKENKYRIFYVNNEKLLLDSFKTDVINCFGEIKLYTRRRLNRGDEVWLPSTVGSLVYIFLDYQSRKKQVPSIIMNCQDEKVIRAFLQAIYDDEGFLYPSRKMIVMAQVDLSILKKIRELLSRLQIKTSRILEHKSKSRSLMYYFTITSRQNIQLFQNKIGFIHPKKIRKLSLLLRSYR